MRITQENKSQDADVGFRYLLVSLFLAVIAFFIVLNSISQVSKVKTEEFFDKVQSKFVGDNLASKFKILTYKNKKSGGSKKTINIKDVIHDFLVNKSVLVISDFTDYGKVVEIKITKGAAFNSDSDYPKTSATKFLREFSDMMIEQRAINRFKLSLVLSYEENNKDNLKLATERSYALLEKMKYNIKNDIELNSYLSPYKSGNKELSFIKIMIYLD